MKNLTNLCIPGTLYILLERSSKQRSLLAMHNWDIIARLWPAILRAPPSEKPSIIQLFGAISTLLYRSLETSSIHRCFTEGSINSALSLSSIQLTAEELSDAAEKERKHCQNNEKLYYQLLDSLLSLLNSGSLHWRLYNLGFTMMCLQLRADLPLPPACVRLFVQNLLHDAIAVRRIAIKGTAAILKQQKRKHKKIVIQPQDIAHRFSLPLYQGGTDRTGPGDQWDNSWMQYHSLRRPLTVEAWNEPR